jgi:D-sedoheptulose 7-phosphate isomerase
VSNDLGFGRVFSRQIDGLGREEDMLIGISTSGKSPSVLLALEQAARQNIFTVLLTGDDGYIQAQHIPCDLIITTPGCINTARVQECHEFILHVLADQLERSLGLVHE